MMPRNQVLANGRTALILCCCFFVLHSCGEKSPVVLPVTPSPPSADFRADVTSGACPLTVTFDNLTTKADSAFWDFGDGTTSGEWNPIHTYVYPGAYDVTLIAFNSVGKVSAVQSGRTRPHAI